MKSRGTRGVPTGEVRVVTAAGNVTMLNDGLLIVNKTSGAATTVTLPPTPSIGAVCGVMDGKGDAYTNPITIQGAAGKTINGATTYVIRRNYGSAAFQYNGTDWSLIGATAAVVVQAAAGVAVHDSATEAVSAAYTIPANTFKAGSLIEVTGVYRAPTTVGTDTLRFRLMLSSTTLGGTALITTALVDVANGSAGQFRFELFGTAAPGAAVAVAGFGNYTDPAGTTLIPATLVPTNFATNADLLLEAALKWSTANANSGQVDWMRVTLNP